MNVRAVRDWCRRVQDELRHGHDQNLSYVVERLGRALGELEKGCISYESKMREEQHENFKADQWHQVLDACRNLAAHPTDRFAAEHVVAMTNDYEAWLNGG